MGVTGGRESVDYRRDGRSLQADLVRRGCGVPVAGGVASGNPGLATPAQCAAASIAKASEPQQRRPVGCSRGFIAWLPACWTRSKSSSQETVIHWHRAGFRSYWRWKSRPLGGRPRTPADIRHLIREMSVANPSLHFLDGGGIGSSNPRHHCRAMRS
jgi:hypothetical protein